MKPLILILVAAAFAQAQTIADTARQERARQAQAETTKVFTTKDIQSAQPTDAVDDAKPGEKSTPGAAAKPGEPSQPGRVPEADFAQEWRQETAKLRTQVRDLTAQEIATQVEMNAAAAQMNAPRTTQSAKDQAQRALEASDHKLHDIRTELAKTQRDLEEKELQIPPQQKEKRQDDRPRFFPN